MKASTTTGERPVLVVGRGLGAALVVVLLLPLIVLFFSSSLADVARGVGNPAFLSALLLSLRTTLMSLFLVVLTGLPLAWWLAKSGSKWARLLEPLVQLPIVIPPAVVGVALLLTFGRQGVVGQALASWGVGLAFSEAAVVLAQVVVSAPFFVQGAAGALRRVDDDLMTVARTLGATRMESIRRVAVPAALPGLIVAASLAWARSLGEFGATLLFAGNLAGRTQTMPLAIFSAMESDLHLAIVFSLALAALGVLLLVSLRSVFGAGEGGLGD